MFRTLAFTLVVAIVAHLFGYSYFPKLNSPIVTTKNGKLEGRIGYSRDGQKHFQYLSIPYAEPPIDDLRFEPPVPLKSPWSQEVKQAISYSPLCLQMDFAVRGKLLGQEDCLFLNVFTPSLEKKLPVMVWIHGGGFFSGGASLYHPDFYMDENVVVVTINYRLGPLGFLNLEDNQITGNMGLKDQTLALKWVQHNIINFGGDPDQITLFGESAGGGSVHYHMISPASKGLFQKAIVQSGAVTMPTAFSSNPRKVAMHYIKNTECFQEENGRKLANCLKNLDPRKLVEMQIDLMNPQNPPLAFLPSVESVKNEDTFLSENPRQILYSGKLSNNVAVMFGVTSGEGAIRTGSLVKYPEVTAELDKNWGSMIADILFFENSDDIPSEKANKIRDYYFGKMKFQDDLHEFERNFTALSSDAIFFEPIERAAIIHGRKHKAAVYMFYYDYEASLLPSVYSLVRAVRHDDWIHADLKIAFASVTDLMKKWLGIKGPHEFGIPHSAGLLMQWNMEGWTGMLSGPDTEFSKKYVKAMVDFATNGKSIKFDGLIWPSTLNGNQNMNTDMPFMLMSKHPKVIKNPLSGKLRFWKSLKVGAFN